MIIGMREKTRRAEVRVLEVGDEMVKLCVDGEREHWLSRGAFSTLASLLAASTTTYPTLTPILCGCRRVTSPTST
jgi:hypothetical protein